MMENDVEAQLKSYAANKRKEYVTKAGAPSNQRAHSDPRQVQMESVSERTTLLPRSQQRVEERGEWYSSCLQGDETGGCISCKTHQNSIEVLKLPLGRNKFAVHLHYWWPVFVVVSTIPAFWISPMLGTFALIVGGPLLFSTVLVHELGHAVAALWLGGEVNTILLWPLGGVAYISFFGETSPTSDAIVAFAGPLTHVPQFLFWYLCMYVSNDGAVSLTWPVGWGWDFWLSLCCAGMVMQVSLFLFNLIPAFPLDGGRLLAALLAQFAFERPMALGITAFVGSIFGWYLVFNGIGSKATSPFSIFLGWNEIFIGLFILGHCFEMWQYASYGAAHLHPGYPPASTVHLSQQSAAGSTAGPGAQHRGGVHTVTELEQAQRRPPGPVVAHMPRAISGGPSAIAQQPPRQPPQQQTAPKSGMQGPGRTLGTA